MPPSLKDFIDNLKTRAQESSTKNKLLKEQVTTPREQVLALKNEVLQHAGCRYWGIGEGGRDELWGCNGAH
jgi:hypothetical protein